MSNRIVVGAQWGDEGKGKIIDILANRADVVVRYQGGNNAGHTVVKKSGQFILHLIPSGIFNPKSVCVIGNGVVLDPEAFIEEVKGLEKHGLVVKGRLFVSERTHLILPYHRIYDRLREDRKGHTKIGTTGRGIGPAYVDKAMRTGIRVIDLYEPDLFKSKLRVALEEKNTIFRKIYNHAPLSFREIYTQYVGFAREMKPFVTDTALLLKNAIQGKKKILFEGAQGTHLDVDHGTYPFVTSSSVTAGGACVGTGVPPTAIDDVLGVVKAYTTRVGEGPFPTEFDAVLIDKIRQKGQEFGATTGRPRRCGWFDAVLVRYSCMVNGIKSIAVTKLDVLDCLDEIKICTAYKYQGKIVRSFPACERAQAGVEPIYETHPGWLKDTSNIKRYDDLPPNAKKYLIRLSQLLGVPISILSVGSHEKQTLFLKK